MIDSMYKYDFKIKYDEELNKLLHLYIKCLFVRVEVLHKIAFLK